MLLTGSGAPSDRVDDADSTNANSAVPLIGERDVMTIRKYHFDAKSKSVTLAPRPLALFGEPHLLEDEDAAAYNELLARFWDAVKPVDIIEEMFLKDVLDLEWDVLRWRRLKWGLIRARVLEALKDFLGKNLDYQVYLEKFVDALTALLKDLLPESEKSLAKTLARQCAEDESQANDKVQKVLATNKRDLDTFLDDMRTEKAEELVQEYAQRDPDTLTLVNKCLAGAGLSMELPRS